MARMAELADKVTASLGESAASIIKQPT